MAKNKLTEKQKQGNLVYAMYNMNFNPLLITDTTTKEDLVKKIVEFSEWLTNFTKSPIN